MKLSGNTILITGGTSGIGLALAEELASRGNEIIVSGRRENLLKEISAANDRIEGRRLDIADHADIRRFADLLVKERPALNFVVHNAGIMKDEDLLAEDTSEIAEETVTTNLLGPLRLNAALLPHLRSVGDATIAVTTSGLAFVPKTTAPTYAATKAALHSWVQSLRFQLRDTRVAVLEIVPPYVATELQGERFKENPRAMPLRDYIQETVALLEQNPTPRELLVERVQRLRFAERDQRFTTIFDEVNGAG